MREGTPASKLAQIIKERGYNEFDRYDFGTVTSITPTTVKVDGMAVELDAYDLVIAEHLTDHIRSMSLDGGATYTDVHVKSPLSAGDRVIVASMSGSQMYVVIDKAVMI